MDFKPHYELQGRHAFLSASKYSWIRYDDEKLLETYANHAEAMRGTILHEFAATCIKLGQKLQDTQQTLNMYVNDAIAMKMSPEVVLYAGDNAFGTADAIRFARNPRTKKMKLDIHDLKTGSTKANMNQLEIYAAYFCIEYKIKPEQIEIELRIYQNDYIQVQHGDPIQIRAIMEKTMHFNQLINIAHEEGLL